MAPELYGQDSYDNKIDLWALGIMFYYMLFKEYPYKASNNKSIRE